MALTILLVWVGTLGMHVRREYFRGAGERLALGARSLAPGSYWFTVRMNGAAIGFGAASLDTIEGGFRLSDDLILDVPALDTVSRAEAQTRLVLDDSLSLRSFTFRLASAVGRFDVAGVVADPEVLEVEVGAGTSEPERSRLRVAGGPMLDVAVPLRLAASGSLVPGTSVTVRVFDPSTLASREIEVRVTATDTLVVPDSAGLGGDGRWYAAGLDTIPVWRIEQAYGGVRVATWVDEDGLTVRAESPLGFTIERTAFELARQALHETGSDATHAAGYGTLIEGAAIASDVVAGSLEHVDSLAVRLGGVELDGFDLAGGHQTLRGDTLVIRRRRMALGNTAGYSLPYRGREEVERELESTPLIQAGDERIARAAREAVGRTRSPGEAAARLTEWVHRELRKEIAPSLPSAVQVLEAKRGDCNEHTVLYVALARSIGLPARTAVGVVHVRGKFYYHAWPEVWLRNEWIPFDPTLGQAPADASHIRFLVGGLARQVELVRLIGRLQLEVL